MTRLSCVYHNEPYHPFSSIVYHDIGLIRFKTRFIYQGCFRRKATHNDIEHHQYCSSSSCGENANQKGPTRQKEPMDQLKEIHLSQIRDWRCPCCIATVQLSSFYVKQICLTINTELCPPLSAPTAS